MIAMRFSVLLRGHRRLVVMLALAGTLGVVAVLRHHLREEEYRVFARADGRYRVVVRRRPLFFSFPGGAGDAPGRVILEDRAGRVLHESEVEMVQTVDHVDWGRGTVTIPLPDREEWPAPD